MGVAFTRRGTRRLVLRKNTSRVLANGKIMAGAVAEGAAKRSIKTGSVLARIGPGLGRGDRGVVVAASFASERFGFESRNDAGGGDRVLIHERGNARQPVVAEGGEKRSRVYVIGSEGLVVSDKRIETLGTDCHRVDVCIDIVTDQTGNDELPEPMHSSSRRKILMSLRER
jgi:hypothetical protein